LSANTKRTGNLRDSPPIHTVTPKHLIAHLYKVARIEKLMAPKGLVLNGLGVRMESPLVAKSGRFGIIGLSRFGSIGSWHMCQYYYVQNQEICQVKFLRIYHFYLYIHADIEETFGPNEEVFSISMDIIKVTIWTKFR